MKHQVTKKVEPTYRFNLAYRCWKPTKAERVIVCIHGIGDHSGWFGNIGPELAADQNHVYALDLRGFGESLEEGLPRGCVSDFGRHLQDIDDFIVYLRGRHRGKKLYVFGHSLGGVYSLWYAAHHSDAVEGLVLAAPAVVSAMNNRKNAIQLFFANTFSPRKTHNPYPRQTLETGIQKKSKLCLQTHWKRLS